jgi:putative endonuclease
MSTSSTGRHGEDLAAAWYETNGYRILDRNWRIRAGEIDIVAADRDTVVFCEVKTRRSLSHGSGAEAVNRRKQRKIRELARAWLQASDTRFADVRFDVADVDGAGRVSIIEACF